MEAVIDNKRMWESLCDALWHYPQEEWLVKCINDALAQQGLFYKDGEIASIEHDPFTIEKGKWYECINDFIVGSICRFKKGSFYRSEEQECLTDDNGFKYNSFGKDAAEYFRPAKEEEIPQVSVTPPAESDCQWNSGTKTKTSQRMVSAEAKEALLPDELTEFESFLKLIVNTYYQRIGEEAKDVMTDEGARSHGDKLLSIARKQFIEETCEWLRENLLVSDLDNHNYYIMDKESKQLFIENFRKALEKG